ncbi:kinetochore-associated protein DSN1 homolog isoform X1 [Mastomys coucha]|uniref:kinetochore-associated protein DSN1 homolog isoform X1 n=1 Tax=Mastomys coucha TaxID=35658 RepID=UPI0012620ECC|nr:kinetochore-associated protein DSN1 homolog isoform X1 [Mastomys coucha]XP_031228388.1 kinetochore-associated protein DSN1 homolog isoform X1 [Mastomys coucha]XP_031228389.1 kinetochore-associated protein DSN1 homolog isoform X1 [Mastomys coucha]
MTSVTRSEDQEPAMSETPDHQLQPSLKTLEALPPSSAYQEMVTQDVSKEKNHFGPEEGDSCGADHQEGPQLRSFHLDPLEQSLRHQDRRQSWRRASMKEISRRKSLAPFHPGITELSRSISVKLAQSQRLGALLLSSFQFSVEKLEPFLKTTKDFSLECFRAKASSLSEELKHFTERLGNDGTLQKCFVEDSEEKAADFSLGASVAEVKEYITKFSLERQAWDQLLLQYQNEVPPEEMPRGSTEARIADVKVDPAAYLKSSQTGVLTTKPDYQRIVQDQNQVFACMELVMDELQGSVKQLQAFMDESAQYLQKVSVQLRKRSMDQLDSSPARKLLKLPYTTHLPHSDQEPVRGLTSL